MSQCPTCGRMFSSEHREYIYDWGEKTAVYCDLCNTPDRRKQDAPVLTADDFETTRVVKQGWNDQQWCVYLEVGDTPGCIDFKVKLLTDAVEGNTNALEWRLEKEFNRRVDLEGGGDGLASEWFSGEIEEYKTVGGTVSRGVRHE